MPCPASALRKLTFALAILAGTMPAWGRADSEFVPATTDWAIAETLMALDVDPVAMGNINAYRKWMGGGPLPARTINLGTNSMPNLELLAELDPALILIPPYRARLISRFAEIAPVETISSFPYADAGDGGFWQRLRRFTREVGRAIDQEPAAVRLIAETERYFARQRRTLDGEHGPLLTVQLLDERHVRVYGDNSLYQAVLDRLGLRNAWEGDTNAWGFSVVGLDALADIDARLVVLETAFPVGIEHQLAGAGLWQHLPSVRRGDSVTLPPTFWIFGAMPSAKRFGEALVRALESPHEG